MREKHNPIITEYVASGSLSKAFRNAPQPRTEMVECAILLNEAFAGRAPADAALQRAQAVSGEGEDVELYIAFLLEWANLCGKLLRFDEVGVLARRARALLPANAPPEVESLVLSMEGICAGGRGDQAERERLDRLSLSGLAAGSACRPIRLLNLAMILAVSGRLAEIEDEVLALKRDSPGGQVRDGCSFMLFLGRAEAGRMSEALEFAQEFAGNGPLWERYGGTASHWLLMADFAQRQWTGRGTSAGLLSRIPPEGRTPDWLMVTEALGARRPDDALRLARSMGEQRHRSMINETSFPSYALIRAELASGHGQAARRLLDMRRRHGNVNWIDDLFLARVALLDGDQAGAGRLFAAVRRNAGRYRAEGRIELEMHLATELSGGQALRLARIAGSVSAEESASALAPQAPARAETAAGNGLDRLAGASTAMSRVRAMIRHVAPFDVPVLILGETGTGKELAARAIHECSPRAAESFLAVDCGAISETLLESELFGHEKGAFTGAVRPHRGLFEEAGRGTLLLDEIGNIPPRLQAALLRVLEAGEVRPVGSSRARKVACRVLTATNADLDALVAEGRFRADLLFRMKRMELIMPPLRDRREDVPVLAELFLGEGRPDGRRPELSPALAAALSARQWPGNVRELRNAIEHMRLFNSDKLGYDVGDLPSQSEPGAAADALAEPAQIGPAGRDRADEPASRGRLPDGSVEEFLASGETPLRRKERLRGLFRKHGRLTRSEAARVLGVSVVTAAKYLKELRREGLVRKVEPNASPQTHYFELDEAGAGEPSG
mgnify:CR=1 FL=1